MMIDDTAPPAIATAYCDVVFITVPPKSIASEECSTVVSIALRQQQAEATRSRVLAAAAELFAADGYARTTLAKIADGGRGVRGNRSGPGPQGGAVDGRHRPRCVRCRWRRERLQPRRGPSTAGDRRSRRSSGLRGRHRHRNPPTDRSVGARTVRRRRNADDELERYMDDLLASIKLQFRRILEVLRDRGWLRVDVPFDELVETIVVVCSVDTYLRITQRDGWSVDAYRTWCRRMLAETVFVSRSA